MTSIAADNPGLAMPNKAIVLVVRLTAGGPP
jgi:hypothetical protein